MKIIKFPAWLFVLFIATLALGTDEFVISGILPDVAKDLSVTLGTAGLLVTAFALAFCLGSPIVALLTDSFEKRKILSIALIIFSICNFAVAWAPNFEIAIVFRIIAGLSAAAISPLCMVIAATMAPPGLTGRYLALATAGLTVALFTGVPLGAVIGSVYSWRGTFELIAVVGLFTSVFVLFSCPKVHNQQSISLKNRLAPFYNPKVRRLVTSMFLCGSGGLMFYNYLGATMTEHLSSTSSRVIFTLLLVGLVGVVSVFWGGYMVDKFGPRFSRLFIVGGHSVALLLLSLHLYSVSQVDTLFLILITFWSLFAWALSPAMQASIMSVSGEHGMLSMALGISGLYGGAAFGAAIGGYLIDNYSIIAVPLIGAIFLALACSLISFRDTSI